VNRRARPDRKLREAKARRAQTVRRRWRGRDQSLLARRCHCDL